MKRQQLTTPVVAALISIAAACAGVDGGNQNANKPAGGQATPSGNPSSTPTPTPTGTPTPVDDAGAPASGPGAAPPVATPPPAAATYVRGSLKPVYELIDRGLYGLNNPIVQGQAKAMQDSDMESTATTTSAAQKMSDVGAQIGTELGTAAVNVIAKSEDQQRATLIPFRGKPSDVKFVSVGGQTQVFVPLGGDVQTAGNEVSILSVQGNNLTPIQRLNVGVRPQRLAIHPAGLVFVCNQYSNYVSIIDPRTDALLQHNNKPVEIPTEYMCSDLAFVQAPDNNPDHQYLYVANRWRHSVLKYEAFVTRDAANNPVNVVQPDNVNPTPANKPITEILGVGKNPWRLALSDQQDAIFVANNRGGEIARIELGSDSVSTTGRIGINAPTGDVVNINNLIFIPTTMPARGLVDNTVQQVPAQLAEAPVVVTGLDKQPHVAQPGAIFDNTVSYNFEDTRSGLQQLDFLLNPSSSSNFYYTDDISSEPNFASTQKVIKGAGPIAVARNAAGTLLWMADNSSDQVEEFAVNVGNSPNALTSTGRVFSTQHRPFAITADEKNNRLFVADWGSETVEIIDLNSGRSVAQADTGYAQPTYPATNVENGEFNFYSAKWSNNGRKACTSCHYDEMDSDGVGFSQGAIAPTTLAEVKPNHNIGPTGGYFWNGSFANGNYTSLAFGFQTRDNCQIVQFGFVEGAGSDPTKRIGDPNNKFTNGQDSQCRPVDGAPGQAANAAQIAVVDKAELQIAHDFIQKVTGVQFEELARQIDAYSSYAVRLPPNPLHQEFLASQGTTVQLDAQTMADITKGKALFTSAGCAGCHDPNATDHPFTDNLNHGTNATWLNEFISTYQNDPRVTGTIGTFPETMLDALAPSAVNDHEVNLWTRLDYFIFACFDLNNCLEFDDPLQVRGDVTEETRRLNLLITINLQDPDRGFIPGNPVGSAFVNTPSLRGVWSSANFLHHGLGQSIRESIVGPGHPALQPGEVGWAIDQFGKFDVHGATSTLAPADIQALVRYVENIE
ncbi:MAG TPA: beta-propeller fold lactonase family protein [Polyangiaceae bacterium]|jgi:cytochrome c peroxidase